MSYHDWQIPVSEVIEREKVKRVIEFGLGAGTKLFIDKCEYVVSVEFGKSDEWVKKCMDDFKDSRNWIVKMHVCEDKFSPQIKKYIQEIVKGSDPFELAFVDPGVHFRPEIVNTLFGIVPHILAHDTNVGEEDYHWSRIKKPENYTEERLSGSSQGVTYWKRNI